jgi:uncharacterized protein (DUF488 family)
VTYPNAVYTIGHSTHSIETLTELLTRHEVIAVADVRSKPYSRSNPQFNRDEVRQSLRQARIAYVFMGHQLGGRPDDPRSYVDGKLQYDLLAGTRDFSLGLNRVIKGARTQRIALMCAEKDPLTCHRAILIARHLDDRGITVEHILEDGRLERHSDSVARLLAELHMEQPELFRTHMDQIAEAYRQRGQQIAYNGKPVGAETATQSTTR